MGLGLGDIATNKDWLTVICLVHGIYFMFHPTEPIIEYRLVFNQLSLAGNEAEPFRSVTKCSNVFE